MEHTKMRTNVSIDPELMELARGLKLKLSPLLEAAIRQKARELAADNWLAENKGAIASYNEEVAEHSVFSDGLRAF